jgi:hypothetical protein
MQFLDYQWPFQKEILSKKRAWQSSSVAAWAGFCGAIPLGLCLWIPVAILSGDATQQGKLDVRAILWLLVSALPLIPFLISLAFIDRPDWPRVLGIILIGLCVGGSSAILYLFAFFAIIPAVALGLVLGLVKLLPCWWQGDVAGRSLSLLGITPAMLCFFSLIAEEFVRNKRSDSLLGMILTAHEDQYLLAAVLLMTHLLVVMWVIIRIRARLSAKPCPDSLNELL